MALPRKLIFRALASIALCCLLGSPALGFSAPQSAPAKSQSNASQKRASGPAATASASEIAAAKAKGLVWVNTKSRVYHTHGRYYGKTRHGQFMSLADAKRNGYKASRR